MTQGQMAAKLRELARDRNEYDIGPSLEALADELDPPKPEPGLVTYQGIHDRKPYVGWWDGEKLRDYATGRVFVHTALDTLNMKPARLLSSDEVPVRRRDLHRAAHELQHGHHEQVRQWLLELYRSAFTDHKEAEDE